MENPNFQNDELEEDMAAENDVFQDVPERDIDGNVKDRSIDAIPLPSLEKMMPSTEQESDYSYFTMDKPVYRSVPDLERPVEDELALLNIDSLERPKLVSMGAHADSGETSETEFADAASSSAATVGSEEVVVMILQSFYVLTAKTHQDLSNNNEVHVARTISRVLTDEKVDFKFQPSVCRWDCNLTSGATVVHLNVSVFKRPVQDGGKLVLEMQRLHGSVSKFMVLYGSVIEALEGTPNPYEDRVQPSLPPLSLEAEPTDGLDDREFVRNLQDTLKGPCYSHALDSAQAMAKMSTDKRYRDLLKQEGCVRDLLAIVQDGTDFGHVTTCARTFAVTCLANLSEESSIHDALYDAIGVLVAIIGHGSFDDRPMRREAARCLRNLAKEVGGADEIIRRVGKEKLEAWCIDVFPTIVDPRMQSDVGVIKESLDQRWKLVA